MRDMSQDRPCKRCIKRNIGHLCHDEPREGHGYHKKSKTDSDTAGAEEVSPPADDFPSGTSLAGSALIDDSAPSLLQDDSIGLRPPTSDTMAMSDSSAAAASSAINGNAQARKSAAVVERCEPNDAQSSVITSPGSVPRIVFMICRHFTLIICSAPTRLRTSSTC